MGFIDDLVIHLSEDIQEARVMAELLAGGRPLFEARDEVEQLWAIYEVLDTTDGGGHQQQHDDGLRELFPARRRCPRMGSRS